VNCDQVQVRALAAGDLQDLAAFACSAGAPWEELVQQQLRGPLPRRYLAAPPRLLDRHRPSPMPLSRSPAATGPDAAEAHPVKGPYNRPPEIRRRAREPAAA